LETIEGTVEISLLKLEYNEVGGYIYNEVWCIYYGGEIESFWLWIFAGSGNCISAIRCYWRTWSVRKLAVLWLCALYTWWEEPLIFSGQEGDWTPYLVWTVWRRKQLMPMLGKEP